MQFITSFLDEAISIINQLDKSQIANIIDLLAYLRTAGGRLFILGVGGSAANASHAVNDFRKIAGIESYAPTDNVAELTARSNDDGFNTIFIKWLEVSRLSANDMVMILSVGGGNIEKNVSTNLVIALQYAKQIGAKIIGIVSRDGGQTLQLADECILIPTLNPKNITPHAESLQSMICHLLVSHPKLQLGL